MYHHLSSVFALASLVLQEPERLPSVNRSREPSIGPSSVSRLVASETKLRFEVIEERMLPVDRDLSFKLSGKQGEATRFCYCKSSPFS